MNDYLKEKHENARNFYTAHALPIAAALGNGWTAEPPDLESYKPTAKLSHRDGRYFSLSLEKDRIEARAPYIRTKYQAHTKHHPKTITMATTKTPQQLAADIARRLLPPLANYLEIVRESIRRETAEERELNDILGMFAEAGHGQISTSYNSHKSAYRGSLYKLGWAAEYSAYTKRAELKITADPQTIGRILELFQELHPAHGGNPTPCPS